MPEQSAAPVLAGRGLVRSFETRHGPFRRRRLLAVRGVDITVARREVVAVVGESGCGKSTLARMLLGLLPPSAGEVRIDGQNPASLGRRGIARLIQPVFQDPATALNPRRRVGDIIGLPLRVQRIGTPADRAEKLAAAMRQMGLPPTLADRYPAQLSGGQRQRVAIARALIAQPKVLVCDEPTSALDVSVQAQILNLLQDLRAELDLGMVLISHNIAVVEHIADRVIIMYLGQVVEEGPARTTLRNPRHPYTDRLRRSVLSPVPGFGLPPDDADDSLPDPYAAQAGCAFYPRCPRATSVCRTETPPLTPGTVGAVACHHPLALSQAAPSA